MIKNKLFVGLTTDETIDELSNNFDKFLIKPNYCLCIDKVCPAGMIETTEEFFTRFDATDFAWISEASTEIFSEEMKVYPEMSEETREKVSKFIDRFEEELAKGYSDNG